MTAPTQLHLLTAYPTANLSHNDTGAPKTLVLGGATRLRVSLQSLKRAWCTSALFEQALAGHIGVHSGRIAHEVVTILIERGIEGEKAIEWAAKIADYLGKAKNNKKSKDPLTNAKTGQLIHISSTEFDTVEALAHQLAEEKHTPKGEDLALSRKDRMTVGTAMFGCMLASEPEFNIGAACQVACAFDVSETIVEDNFFTTVDDLCQAPEDADVGHLRETGFDSALLHTYICIDKDLLVENLGGDEALANRTIYAFTKVAPRVSPTGEQNNFASRVYASWALAGKDTEQPRSLAVAFYGPTNGAGQLEVAVQRTTTFHESMNMVCEQETKCASFDMMNEQGSMKDVLDFICA